jgi:nucleoside phosphorylase
VVDFLIVTALHKEFLPLLKAFNARTVKKSSRDLHQYYEATVEIGAGTHYSLQLVCIGAKGQKYAAAGLVDAITRWRPRMLVMAGIAAVNPGSGRKPGDILVADRIIDASEWKVKPSKVELRNAVYPCEHELIQSAKSFLLGGWELRVHVGPIISQTNLVRSKALRTWLTRETRAAGDGEAVGIEMEGGGVGAAVETRSRNMRPGFIVVKGGVDFANYHKHDALQVKMAEASAKFLKAYLLSEPIAQALDTDQDVGDLAQEGVERVMEKYDFRPRFWIDLLTETKLRLDLLGHALNKWCEESFATHFADNMSRIVRNGGTVRLLVMKPNGQNQKRISNALGIGDQGYAKRIKQTLHFVRENVFAKLSPSRQKRLQVRYVSTPDLPYMMVRTDRTIVVSPYLAKSDSKRNLLIVLRADTKFAAAYGVDFDKLFKAAERVGWGR